MGCGASEFLFYLTTKELAKYINLSIFNRDIPQILDNIEYKFIDTNLNPNIENINNSVIIIQRHFDIAINLHKINPNNKYIIWNHDYLEGESNYLTGSYNFMDINNYFSQNNIKIISVSNFHRNNIKSILPNVSVTPIYNSLFPEYFVKNKNINYDKNKLIFASNWAKGLDRVLNIGMEYYKYNKEFKLLLIKPTYCEWNPELQKYPFIEKIGCITNKVEYCNLLQECLALLSTSFPETFGCVFAEALHLGVPVIGDSSIQAGFHEIIPQEFMCNFNKPNEVINKIESFRNRRPSVNLDEKFYSESVIEKWKDFILSL